MHPVAVLFFLGAAHGAVMSTRHYLQDSERSLDSDRFDDRDRKGSELGSHLVVPRIGYSHHGIYVGEGDVIHYSGEPTRKRHASVRIDRLEVFAAGRPIRVLDYSHCDSPARVVARARSRLGEREYDLIQRNCEHFATWCKVGTEHSRQIRNMIESLNLGVHAPMAMIAIRLAELLQSASGTDEHFRIRPFNSKHA